MSGGKKSDACILCGAPLKEIYPAQVMYCAICGRKYTDVILCKEGHYICERCGKDPGREVIRTVCTKSSSKNPIEIAIEIMDSPVIDHNQQEHHSIVAAVLLTAYKNCGGNVPDFKEALNDVIKRGSGIPYLIGAETGTSGCAMSAGIFYSILSGLNPQSVSEWTDGHLLVSSCLVKMSKTPGPSCCKRCTFTSIDIAAEDSEKYFRVAMEMPEKIQCKYAKKYRDCIKERCPYYPQ